MVSSDSQDASKVFHSGDAMFEPLVRIRPSNKLKPDDDGAEVWFDGSVAFDADFSIAATDAGETKLKAGTGVHAFDMNGGLLQTIPFHTSCSHPLNEGGSVGQPAAEGLYRRVRSRRVS